MDDRMIVQHDATPKQADNSKRVPLDILLSLLRPGELEMLRRYITSYLGNVRQRRQTDPSTQKE
jgi:hypothetical protein